MHTISSEYFTNSMLPSPTYTIGLTSCVFLADIVPWINIIAMYNAQCNAMQWQ